jgi:ring-1,2-phenylacetyl-CoA epoxidase subunit PaaC
MSELKAHVQPFIELLETIADNKYVLGDRLIEVGVSGPDLGATLASVAMSQGELGHARLFYNWSFDLKHRDERKQKIDIKEQTGKAFSKVVGVDNWISLIAAIYTVNTGIRIVLESLEDADHKVSSRVVKMVREQHEHIEYAKQWAERLLNDEGAVPYKFRESLNGLIDEVSEWLGRVEANGELQSQGILPRNARLIDKFKEELKAVNSENVISVQ